MSDGEMLVSIPSIIMGVGMLFLPRVVANHTIGGDGWISVVAGGLITIIIAWCIAKLAASYPGKSFMDYTSEVATKPIAIILSLLFALVAVNIVSYQIISISEISGKYIFDRTPVEIIGVTFFLVVIYAVSGTRVGIFRLNLMFFPIIIVVSTIVMVASFPHINMEHLKPMFQTDTYGYLRGIKLGIISYSGVAILLFYVKYMRKPKNAPKMAVIGVVITMVVYTLLFV